MPLLTNWNVFSSIKITRLQKRFENKILFKQIDVSFSSGECVMLLGKNGAGKSSLLRIISLQDFNFEGELCFFMRQPTDVSNPNRHIRPDSLNNNISSSHPMIQVTPSSSMTDSQVNAIKQRIGFVGHSPAFYNKLSALENLTFFGNFYLNDPSFVQQRARWLLQHFNIPPMPPISQFSYGTLQKISLCRAFLHQPSFILLDEPYQGLDDSGVAQLNILIQESKAQKAIVILVTHTPQLAQATTVTHQYQLDQGSLRAINWPSIF